MFRSAVCLEFPWVFAFLFDGVGITPEPLSDAIIALIAFGVNNPVLSRSESPFGVVGNKPGKVCCSSLSVILVCGGHVNVILFTVSFIISYPCQIHLQFSMIKTE